MNSPLMTTLALLSLWITACSSSPFRVQSSPDGAEVSIVSIDGSATKVGKTPVEVDPNVHRSLFNDTVQVKVAKDGFTSQSVVLPRLGAVGSFGSLNFNLQETALPRSCVATNESLNEMAHGIAAASHLIQKKSYGEAVVLLQGLGAKFPDVAVVHDLQGNVFYLQRQLDRALEAYRRSNAIAPNNAQTLRMMQKIQQLQGVRPEGG